MQLSMRHYLNTGSNCLVSVLAVSYGLVSPAIKPRTQYRFVSLLQSSVTF